MLGIGQTRFHELLNKGELEGFKDGGRWITVASVKAYVERQLSKAKTEAEQLKLKAASERGRRIRSAR